MSSLFRFVIHEEMESTGSLVRVQTIYSNSSSFISYISNNASSFRNNLDEEQQTRRWFSIKQSSIFCLSVCQLTCVDYVEMTFLVELYFERKKKTFHQTTKCVRKYEICKVIGWVTLGKEFVFSLVQTHNVYESKLGILVFLLWFKSRAFRGWPWIKK